MKGHYLSLIRMLTKTSKRQQIRNQRADASAVQFSVKLLADHVLLIVCCQQYFYTYIGINSTTQYFYAIFEDLMNVYNL